MENLERGFWFEKIDSKWAVQVMTLLLGGCTTNMEEGEKTKESTYLWPDTPAFKDDFTREFMESTEEMKGWILSI